MVLLIPAWSFFIISFSMFIFSRVSYFLNSVFHNLCLINPISEIFWVWFFCLLFVLALSHIALFPCMFWFKPHKLWPYYFFFLELYLGNYLRPGLRLFLYKEDSHFFLLTQGHFKRLVKSVLPAKVSSNRSLWIQSDLRWDPHSVTSCVTSGK